MIKYLISAVILVFAATAAAQPFILETVPVEIKRTALDHQWNRVYKDKLSKADAEKIAPMLSHYDGEELISYVNTSVNNGVDPMSDQAQYGVVDYWATATETVKSRKGDCEDLAILKMKLLRLAGIPDDRLVLVVAKDLVTGGRHSMLIVVDGGRAFLLDNNLNRLFDASERNFYLPIFSFTGKKKYVHGYYIGSGI